MRYNININNKKAKEWNLNVQQAYLFVFFYELPSWANSITYDNETYYFASKNKAIEEMPLLTDKRDTMYRYYKQLENKGLIKLVKVEGKDYAKLTNKGKEWNWESDTSDKNPNKLGNKSESNSDKNPTYNNTISNNNTSINKVKDFFILKCKQLPQPKKITSQREKHINARIKEYDLQTVLNVIEITSKTPFLNGKNKENWKADFDWILNPNNFIKILEGKYNTKKKTNQMSKIGAL